MAVPQVYRGVHKACLKKANFVFEPSQLNSMPRLMARVCVYILEMCVNFFIFVFMLNPKPENLFWYSLPPLHQM
ncbi:hypothetical protein Hanom_Chr01g00065831 [Helianthus anomalus]